MASALKTEEDPSLGGHRPIYFWNPDDGRWQQFFSQWYDCRFKDTEGVEYSTTEMYMMYQKALLFGDQETAEKIRREFFLLVYGRAHPS